MDFVRIWRYTKRMYSLDTLDTRYTVSAHTPQTKASSAHGVDARSATVSNSSQRQNGNAEPNRDVQARAQPSKWGTSEYYFYYFIFLTIVPMMFYVPYSVSRESNPEYKKFAPLLSDGWVPGRKVDNSDTQYKGFRDNIPYMAILLFVHPLLRKAFDSWSGSDTSEGSSKSVSAAAQRLQRRRTFDLVFGIIFIFALNGTSALKVYFILYLNYLLATKLPRSSVPLVAWTFNILVLFANETFEGYKYSKLAAHFSVADPENNWGSWLEGYGGLLPRWEILFNITVLRLLSFDMDYYWSLGDQAANGLEKQLPADGLSERDRVKQPAAPEHYCLSMYFAYVLYSPLYLAGPILTFNDYVYQLQYPPPSITRTRTTMYGIRLLATLLTMELVLHFIYAVAISKSNPSWSTYTPFQLSMLGYFNLHIIWLKLLIPWRFFRLWALIDGIDPPENMTRCMSDNYSAMAFWRGWHRSFNRWLVRYLFVPLGGSGGRGVSMFRGLLNTLAVFTFVALWHDISARLLAWGWLIVLFILPELLCTYLFPAKKYKDRPDFYRWLCGVGAVGNILMMMAANLVGFALGLDGLKQLADELVSGLWGWTFLVMACATLFVGVQVMFEVREEEKRKGIDLKY